jgi:hypothetical protein
MKCYECNKSDAADGHLLCWTCAEGFLREDVVDEEYEDIGASSGDPQEWYE